MYAVKYHPKQTHQNQQVQHSDDLMNANFDTTPSITSNVSLRSPLTLSANLQWLSDFLPFNIRRRRTSMPLRVLIRLIQPWVLFLLMFFGWYSVPRVRVRTCWYCQGSWGNTPEPPACVCRGPHPNP